MPDTLSEHDADEELQCYTLALARGDLTFIHQHVVDAWAAQHADSNTKPIRLAFALVGLYLHLERGFSGRQVQRVHMKLSRRSRRWPSFPLPRERGRVTAVEGTGDSPWSSSRPSHRCLVRISLERLQGQPSSRGRAAGGPWNRLTG